MGSRINAPTPNAAAEAVEPLGVLAGQERLGFAVAGLLAQIGLHGRAAVVPDKSRRTEADLVFAVLQAPAEVHVIAGLAKHRIETAYLLQRPLEECHVA